MAMTYFNHRPRLGHSNLACFLKNICFFNRDHTTKDASAGIITACVHFRRKELFWLKAK